jgi:hypothetical protein
VGQDRKLLVENREQMPRKSLGANLFALNKILHCDPKGRSGSSCESAQSDCLLSNSKCAKQRIFLQRR